MWESSPGTPVADDEMCDLEGSPRPWPGIADQRHAPILAGSQALCALSKTRPEQGGP